MTAPHNTTGRPFIATWRHLIAMSKAKQMQEAEKCVPMQCSGIFRKFMQNSVRKRCRSKLWSRQLL
ncbi:hypothetical protein LCM4573_08885 [Rhizobium sp. LCM 4573]|nr:hypothetical protein LCM4573_08885 [Rhizobium sp. LCM 4573]